MRRYPANTAVDEGSRPSKPPKDDETKIHEPAVLSAVHDLAELHAELLASIDELEKRLIPVLQDQDVANPVPDTRKERNGITPLVRDLAAQCDEVVRATNHIHDMTRRLEI